MGNCMNKKGARQPITLAILGLDNAGKTVTAKGLTGESLDTVAPTLGYSAVEFTQDKYDVKMYDLGGGKKIRGIWKNYLADIYGVIYVVDSSAKDRIDECHATFLELLQHSQVQGKPLLILANKQDKSGALDEVDICDQLNLEELVNKFKTPCRVEPCSATLGQGKKLDKSIKQGIQWLLAMITRDWEELHERVQKDVAVKAEKQAKEKKERAERVRKVREERERKEKEERLARGEAEPESDDEVMVKGDPFRRLSYGEVEKKEKQLKEEKRKKKEQENARKTSSDTNSRKLRGSAPSLEEEDGDMSVPSQKSRRQLPALNGSDMYPVGSTHAHHPTLGKLGQFDSPRPNRRFVKGVSQSMQSPSSDSDEDKHNVRTTSSLTNAHWLREGQAHHHGSELSPPSSAGLTPFGHPSGELGSQQRRRVLAPLTPLEPLESLDLEGIDQKNKKKKKKAKKNQTRPDGAMTEESLGWPALRASRSPRLDTVQEPDNESDPGQVSFSRKHNLLEELPELPSSRSQRLRPNTDYDDSLVT